MTFSKGQETTPQGREGIEKAAKLLKRSFGRLNDQLTAHPNLVGDRFTVADLNMAECVRYAQAHPTLLGEYPALRSWLETCQARPAFQDMWTKRAAEPV
jgi:glutathione S-transferase